MYSTSNSILSLNALMKKLFVLILWPTVFFSQTYDFTDMFVYENTTNEKSNQVIVYSNHSSTDYYLNVSLVNSQKRAFLVDLKNKKVHELSILEKIKNDSTYFQFEKISSFYDHHYFPKEKLKYYEYSIESIDDEHKRITLHIFENKRKKKQRGELHFIVKNDSVSYFFAFKHALSLAHLSYTIFDFPHNGVVISMEGSDIYRNAIIEHFWQLQSKLIKHEPVTLEISVN